MTRRLMKLGCFIFMLVIFLCPISALAAEGWSVLGDAAKEDEKIILQQEHYTNYYKKDMGVYAKNVPVDTKKGFKISFDYWNGNVKSSLSSSNKGGSFEFIMSAEPVDEFGVDYDTWDDTHFHSLTLQSYKRSDNEVCFRYKNGKNVTSLMEKISHAIDKEKWHKIELCYGNQLFTVKIDEEIILKNVSCKLPNVVYLAFQSYMSSGFTHQKHSIKNITLQATDALKINLNASGGQCSKNIIYVSTISGTTLPTPTKDNYTFLGWYTKKSGGTKVNGNNYSFSDNQTIYVHWKDNRLKITLKPNKGKMAKKCVMISKGEKIGTLPIPKRAGYTFLGWYTKKSSGKKIDTSYAVTKNITLYAQWIKNSKKIKITLNKNGGSCKKSSVNVKINTKLGKLPTATRKGYIFLGWYTKKSGGKKVNASTKMKDIYPAKKLYAHWSKKNSSNSSNTHTNNKYKQNCTMCGGTGRCKKCGGDGYIYSYVIGSDKRNCTRCNASGRCTYCGGTGKRK